MIAKTLRLLIWAARENLRQPGSNFLLAICLAGLTLALALVLLVSATLERTSTHMLARAPDLVVRRLGPDGWQPLPVAPALKAVENLPGINRAHPRVWGLVQSGDLSVTALALDPDLPPDRLPPAEIAAPARGHAITGQWWRPHGRGTPLVLNGHRTMAFEVDAVLAPDVDLAAYDTVLLHPADARTLLGLADGWASDLALDVFHPGEAAALRPELRKALPWPVNIRTRTETLEWYRSGFSRRSSLVVLMWLPAVAALGLMVLAVVQRQSKTAYHAGLLKALGWTTGDILRLHLYQALIIALPSVMIGMTLAYSLVGGPLTEVLARVLLGWRGGAPAHTLAPGAHPLVFMGVGVFVLLPFLAAVLGPALKTAAVAPDVLLREEA
jgi:hypothetical protein